MKFQLSKITRMQMIIGVFGLVGLVLIATIWIEFSHFGKLKAQIANLTSRLEALDGQVASTTNEIKGTIAKTNDNLVDQLNKDRLSVSNLAQNIRQEVGSVSNTVSTLQKLSKTDPELLAKYSKVFFLNENYAPARLIEIPNAYVYSNTKILKLIPEVWTHLQQLIDGAKRDDVEMYVFSAYRSFNEQQALKGQYTVTYGAGTANTFSADQGYSEHQLGTTIDMIAPGLGGDLDGFDGTSAYNWLLKNAYKYGFVISYPKDNKFYVFEPWHWRFVGVKLATDLHNQNKYFYDLDQRAIDEYLVNLFD